MENKAGGGCKESLNSLSDWANGGAIYQGGKHKGGVDLGRKIKNLNRLNYTCQREAWLELSYLVRLLEVSGPQTPLPRHGPSE